MCVFSRTLLTPTDTEATAIACCRSTLFAESRTSRRRSLREASPPAQRTVQCAGRSRFKPCCGHDPGETSQSVAEPSQNTGTQWCPQRRLPLCKAGGCRSSSRGLSQAVTADNLRIVSGLAMWVERPLKLCLRQVGQPVVTLFDRVPADCRALSILTVLWRVLWTNLPAADLF